MSKLHRVTLSGDYDHHAAHGDERVFRAGVHAMPTALRDAARAAGKVESSTPIEDAKPAAAKRVRALKPKAATKTAPMSSAPATAKPFPAKTPAKKPAAKKAKA